MIDLIMHNGLIRTQDPSRPEARALAVDHGRILAVGSDSDIRKEFPRTRSTIDLAGRLVLPGLVDTHTHLLSWAQVRRQGDLLSAPTRDAFLERLAGEAAGRPKGEWVQAWGLDEGIWPENRMPDRTELDAAAPDHPVFLRRKDGHMAVVNSAALSIAGIGEDVSDPAGGRFDRGPDGRLNGLIRERAVELVTGSIPRPGVDEIVESVRQGLPVLHAMGLTGVHDLRIPRDDCTPFQVWQELDRRGELNIRCWMCLPGELRAWAGDLGLMTGFGNDRLKVGHLKYFLDGSMGSQTAWMKEPYLDGALGLPVFDLSELGREIEMAQQAGLAVAVHSIGDRANREIITLLEGITRSAGGRALSAPHRLEHVQIIDPEDVVRLAALPVSAAMQPLHQVEEMAIHEDRIGDRSARAFPFRDMMTAGTNVIFGSDCPVSSPDPWLGIQGAVTRQTPDGRPAGGWYPEQRIDVDEAVKAYTIGPARSCGLEKVSGSLTPGKQADLIVLNQDIYTVSPLAIAETKVDLTVFDGRVVYSRS